MSDTIRRLAAGLCAALLGSVSLPARAAAVQAAGEIRGHVRAPDGHPASGWGVLLLSQEGELVARAEVSPRGEYRLERVPAGSYALAAQDREGRFAPVVGPPTQVMGGAATRRDVRLVVADGPSSLRQTTLGPPGESWWSRQTRNQKIWTVVGIGLGVGAVLAAVSSLIDDDETAASGY